MVDRGEIRKVGRQIKLPWSKAVEIAAKSLKTRFGRSLVTTASIVLAIAFLMSILTGTTLVTSLKTEPVRHAVRLRERSRKAREGAELEGVAFPDDATVESVRREIGALEEQLSGKVAALEKRLFQAELAAANAKLAVLPPTPRPQVASRRQSTAMEAASRDLKDAASK